MVDQISLGGITIDVVFKDIKNVHLSVYPPTGNVRISAPVRMSLETIRAFASTRITWIKRNQSKQVAQDRETPREYIERESHYLWGNRFLLRVHVAQDNLGISADHRSITMRVKPEWNAEKRQSIMEEWYRQLLKEEAWKAIRRWEPLLGVQVNQVFVQRMRTKWGSAHPRNRNVRLNTELARKPKACLDYIVLHEMIHFLVPNHGEKFVRFMSQHMPQWHGVRDQLNAAPLSHLTWSY